MTYRGLVRKGQQGFTLVEVIVVAVIVAILAGVSIPLYLGYINSTRDNSAVNAAGSAASFAAACVNRGDEITPAAGGSITGDGVAAITCGPAGGPVVASLVVPPDILLTFTATTITGKHAESAVTSDPFTYAAP